ncbi:MAG: hypothetical protein J1E64_00220 [Acetatifactor sp.]|nr:hypothetical protein [Acetatifactor sp.]
MLKLRKKLAQYQEQFYLVFILSMVGLISAGFNSEDKFYLVVFFVATLFLLLKMAVTDFTWREILWMAVITLLLGINLLRNGEKTLIMTVIGVFGAKNISLEKVFRQSLWLKIVLTVGTILCASVGIIENEALLLPKNSEHILIYCYGYIHPNATFANIFLIFVIAILVWKDKLKWYAYAGFSLVLLAVYSVLICRTGLLVWGALLIIVLGYKISCKLKWERIYLTLLLLIPVTMAMLTFLLPLIGMRNDAFLSTVDYYLTGRIHHLIQFWSPLGSLPLGNAPREPFDSSYFYLVYNYGWVMALVCFFAYLYTMWNCIRKNRPYEVIILSTMALYGFMEHWPLSVGWNLSLLYLSHILFKNRVPDANMPN